MQKFCLSLFFFLFWYHCKHLFPEKNWALLTDLLKVKKPSFGTSRGNLNMAMAPYRYTLQRIAKRWRSRDVITSMVLGFTFFCLLSPDNFFVFIYTFLSIVLDIDFFYLQLILYFYLILKR